MILKMNRASESYETIWDNNSGSSVHITGVPDVKGREFEAEKKKIEETMNENLQNL